MSSHRRLLRLKELAQRLNVDIDADQPSSLQSSIAWAGNAFENEASDTVQANLATFRQERFAEKKHLLSRQPSKKPFTAKEKHAVLRQTIKSGSAVEVKELLEMGADVNIERTKSKSLIKKISRKDKSDVRSDALKSAVGDHQKLALLVEKADEQSIEESMAEAVQRRDIKSINILLASGAEPNRYQDVFLNAVRSSTELDVELVRVLTHAKKELSPPTATIALEDGIRGGKLAIVVDLVRAGARVDVEESSALQLAIRLERWDLVAALCLSRDHPPTARGLAASVDLVADDAQAQTDDLLLRVEILLAAGAEGEALARALARAVRQERHELIGLLLNYDALDYDASQEAIKSSMLHDNLSPFEAMLTKTPSCEAVDALLLDTLCVPDTVSERNRLQITESLLKKGTSNPCRNQVLTELCKTSEVTFAQLLARYGASADFMDGQSFSLVALSQSLPMLHILLSTKPRPESALPAVGGLKNAPPSIQIQFLQVLLPYGVAGDEVNAILEESVCRRDALEQRFQLTKMLVGANADVNVSNGVCLLTAVQRADVEYLEVLLGGSPSVPSVSSALEQAQHIPDKQVRYIVMQMLLDAGADGDPLQNTLLALIDGTRESDKFVNLFLQSGRVDINFMSGQHVYRAVENQQLEALSGLIRLCPATAVVDGALRLASTLEKKVELGSILIPAGATQSLLNDLLVEAIRDIETSHTTSTKFTELLLAANASVDHQGGRALQLATSRPIFFILLLKYIKTAEALSATIAYVLHNLRPIQALSFCRLVLEKAGEIHCVHTDVMKLELSRSLPKTLGSHENFDLFKLILEHGASVDFNDGEAAVTALEQANIEALQLLFQCRPSRKVLSRCFRTAWAVKRNKRVSAFRSILETARSSEHLNLDEALIRSVTDQDRQVDLIRLFLQFQASIYAKSCQCLYDACRKADLAVLSLLLEYAKDHEDISTVFAKAFGDQDTRRSQKGAQCLLLLIPHVKQRVTLNSILLSTVQDFDKMETGMAIMNCLLKHGANINYHEGLIVERAAASGNRTLLTRILELKPPTATLASALSYLLNARLGENITNELVIDFFNVDPAIDLNLTHRELEATLFLCMGAWPGNNLVLETLLAYGAFVDQRIRINVDGRTQEWMNALLWALSQPSAEVNFCVIKSLIDAGAKVNFVAEATGRTPLLVAVRELRLNAVAELLLHQADPSARDANGFSSLMLATQAGNLAVAKLLCEAGAKGDDGSLQEAARQQRPDIVKYLLDHGHSSLFASPLHGYRAALEEVILHAHCSNQTNTATADVIRVLLNHGANLRFRNAEGKSLVILALEHPQAPLMTLALLSVSPNDYLKDEIHIFREGGKIMSPIWYLSKAQRRKQRHDGELVQILRSYACPEIYYSESFPQPKDYIGAPRHVEDENNRVLAREKRINEAEEEHLLEIRRVRELDDERRRAEQQAHDHRLYLQQKQHDATMALNHEASCQAIALQTAQDESITRAETARRQAQLRDERAHWNIRVEGEQRQAAQRIQAAKEVKQIESSAMQEQERIQKRIESDRRQTIKENESSAMRQYQREASNMATRKSLLDRQSSLLDKQKQIAAASAQRSIGWTDYGPD